MIGVIVIITTSRNFYEFLPHLHILVIPCCSRMRYHYFLCTKEFPGLLLHTLDNSVLFSSLDRMSLLKLLLTPSPLQTVEIGVWPQSPCMETLDSLEWCQMWDASKSVGGNDFLFPCSLYLSLQLLLTHKIQTRLNVHDPLSSGYFSMFQFFHLLDIAVSSLRTFHTCLLYLTAPSA